MGLPTEDTVEKALHMLAETDIAFAQAKAGADAAEHVMKVIRAREFLAATGTVAEREASAYASENYGDALDRYNEMVLDRETLAARRKRAELSVEVWRSLNANRRQGT